MANIHRMTIGAITCVVLHEGESRLDMEALKRRYPGVSESELNAAQQALGESIPAQNHLNCLYVESGGANILVDVGFGPERQPQMGNVIPGLREAGVNPGDVDIVYLTHFHGDHIMGLIDSDGKPNYPNARYITGETEWNHWMETWAQSDQESHRTLHAMMESLEGKFSFVADGDEIARGVCVVNTPGHTPGHTGLLLESEGERLLDLVDVLHSTMQFANTRWHFGFDSDGNLAEATRNTQLARCADENLLTLFYHLPFPGLGHVVRQDDVYRWQPVDS